MNYKYQIWGDFGPQGLPPESVEFEYFPRREITFSDANRYQLRDLWERNIKSHSNLIDNPSLNLLEVSDNMIRVGPTSFREHHIRKQLLSGMYEHVPDDLRIKLEESIHLLSSMTAIVNSGQLLLGTKQQKGTDPPFLSLPGSGYLDRKTDVESESVRSTREVIAREIHEETCIDEFDSIRCIGVYEDLHPDSHLNPALFSVVYTSYDTGELYSLRSEAKDADEFVDIATVPVNEKTLSALVKVNLEYADAAKDISELPFNRINKLSHKTLLLLLLLGRYEFGTDWFKYHLKRSDSINFCER